ncbi:unnamed protein product [Acanthoscelides obtectus]|uniref:Uncharacterized protein n=1 Tax=Acanthoscelides obtectus TaxID=200917 RepID=A0A9P0L7U7_ACAOB|nr:unnamed protein product [Acanthoscelides obtectus]CAK1641797.1 hypothetical protein AOBTE_LOCUS12639 [Acanthoscelides obtectus]
MKDIELQHPCTQFTVFRKGLNIRLRRAEAPDYGAAPSKRIRFGDPDSESTVLKWFNEIVSGSDEGSDSESDFEQSEHDTDSEQDGEETADTYQENEYENTDEDESESADQEVANQASATRKHFYEKNRFKWSSESFISHSRTQKHNTVLRLPTLRGPNEQLGQAAQPSEVFLATGLSYRALADSFRMGFSTVASIVKEVCTAIWEELQPIHLGIPSEQDFVGSVIIINKMSTDWERKVSLRRIKYQ